MSDQRDNMPDQERIQILFVDDEPGVLNALQRQFHRHSKQWKLVFANTPAEALDIIRTCPADIVITDLKMPGMDGLTLIGKMREIAPDSAYMVLTGTAEMPTVINAINEAGVYRFYTKPCPRDQLLEGINAAIALMSPRRATEKSGMPVTHGSIGALALNRIPTGIMIVDRAGHVRLTNQACNEILAEKDGLFIDAAGFCRAPSPDATQMLHERIAAVANSDMTTELDSLTVAIERKSMRRPFAAMISPLHDDGSGETMVVLMIRDPEVRLVPAADDLAAIFSLTRSEATIACALADGQRLEEAAERAGVTISTARTYLKHIFAKTGTNRQSELVKLVLAYSTAKSGVAAA